MPVELLIVGSVALDSVETARAKRERILGGSASFAATAASFFTTPALCGVVGDDFPEEHITFLRERGILMDGLERAAGKTFFWSGRYAPDFSSRTSLDTQLNVFADFRPKLPAPWRDPRLLLLGNIHPSLQLEVLAQVARPAIVACDTMNLWIDSTPKELRELLSKVDVLLLNDEEARQLSGEHALLRAARGVLALGPRSVVVKRGDAGALLFHDGRIFAAPAFPLDDVVDPTGAGDTFAGGFMGALAGAAAPGAEVIRRAMICGSVLASFNVEDFSLDRLRHLTMAEIGARYRAFRDLVDFTDLDAHGPAAGAPR